MEPHAQEMPLCGHLPESSSHPTASVFFGPVLWGRVWRDKALIVYRQIYIYIFTADRERKDDCVFSDNKAALSLGPIRMLCGFPTDTFLFERVGGS